MKFQKLPVAQILPGDPAPMRDALTTLEQSGLTAKRPTKHQLKLDEKTSFYPSRGTMITDGADAPWPERGNDALKKWIDARPFSLVLG